MVVGIHPDHLRKYVIEPTLAHLAGWNQRIKSEAAIRLLLMTAAHESRMGRFLHQQGGPALGIYQMEPFTHDDLWSWIDGQDRLAKMVGALQCSAALHEHDELMGNLYYATAMARLLYWRRPEPLPDADDLVALAQYAKDHFNTRLGKATMADYAKAYQEFVVA